MAPMNALDIVLLVIAAVLVLLGLVKGFVRLLVMIAALFVAFVLASRFHQGLAEHLTILKISMEVTAENENSPEDIKGKETLYFLADSAAAGRN